MNCQTSAESEDLLLVYWCYTRAEFTYLTGVRAVLSGTISHISCPTLSEGAPPTFKGGPVFSRFHLGAHLARVGDMVVR